jgi:hypothetical protein
MQALQNQCRPIWRRRTTAGLHAPGAWWVAATERTFAREGGTIWLGSRFSGQVVRYVATVDAVEAGAMTRDGIVYTTADQR